MIPSKETMLDLAFIALCVQSEDESDKSAQELIVEVIMNRTQNKKYPSMVMNVILQKAQFSYFNNFGSRLRKTFDDLDLIAAGTDPTTLRKMPRAVNWRNALDSVVKKIDPNTMKLKESSRILDPGFVFMYAPRSMQKGVKEPWWWKADVELEYVHNNWVFGKAR